MILGASTNSTTATTPRTADALWITHPADEPEVEEAFDQEIQGCLSGSVWTKCSSWYRNENGRVSTNWPGPSLE